MDYQNGKIYTIRSPHTTKYYIGGTTQTLAKRFSYHKKYPTLTSKDIISLGDAYIELMELCPCNSVEELRKREGELIREHKENCVNKNIAGRTKDIWRKECGLKQSNEYSKKYYENMTDEQKQKAVDRKREARLLKKQSNLVDTQKK